MQFYEKAIPAYLTRKGNLVKLLIYTAVFALAFINIYDPFGVDTYLELSGIRLFLYSSFVILTGMLVVVISRIIMYFYSRHKTLNYGQYVLWVFLEILVMAFVYSIYVKFILADPRDFMEIASVSMKNTSLVILLPYTILWLFFSWQDKSIKLQQLEENDLPPGNPGTGMIPFRDEKGTLRLSVLHQDLLYLEAADNYVSIHYLHVGKEKKFMVRNAMRHFEIQFKDSSIIRCHRSYMVNLDKVRIIRKEKDGLHLELDSDPSISLLVSKTYVQGVMEAFSRISPLDA
ncbi:MAG: LytTR family DNA-binding domain-containing protein [Bacteroidota bacterium]